MHLIRVLLFLPLTPAFTAGCSDNSPTDPTATRIVITVQPSTAETGKTIQPGVEVALHDLRGNLVPGYVGNVTIVLATPSGGATLIGTTTVQAKGGIATFDDIGVDLAGTGYTLIATAGAVTATSESFSVTPAPPFVAVSVGESHSCGLTAAGAVYCWGRQRWVPVPATELSRPTMSMRQHATPEVPVSAELTVVSFFTSRRTLPSLIASTTDFTAVASGILHSCALSSSGTAHCWGVNWVGELGDGTRVGTHVPTPVTGNLRFASLTVGALHTCGLTTAGAAYCWGAGLLGDGSRVSQRTPVAVQGGLTFTSLDAGYEFTCGVADGSAYCWGENNRGQLGDGTKTTRLVPTRVASDVGFTSVTAGGEHACALTAMGVAYCWGSNVYGAVGDGTTSDRLTPVPVATDVRFSALTAGGVHNCGITAVGVAYCWGDNSEGELGEGTCTDSRLPVRVAGEASFSVLRAGIWYTCGVATGGGARCWGKNDNGQLGDGTETSRLVPVAVR